MLYSNFRRPWPKHCNLAIGRSDPLASEAVVVVVVVAVVVAGCGRCVGRWWWSLSVVVVVDRSWLSWRSSSWYVVVVAGVEFLDKTSLGCRGSLVFVGLLLSVVVVGLLWSLVIVALLLFVVVVIDIDAAVIHMRTMHQ